MIILSRDRVRLADHFVAGKGFVAVDCRGGSIRLLVVADGVRFRCSV